ncbi:hypothetical protein GCM10023322_00730 [Rugosimonospora acidiphila]|uniref:Uncharacterized protein n=1 Tax=Rugosimonospora acidiphila TaxID=556531 RepID=A0ABP9RH01_9ACTN
MIRADGVGTGMSGIPRVGGDRTGTREAPCGPVSEAIRARDAVSALSPGPTRCRVTSWESRR